jgi:uncharacterized protein (UPF0332 family)
VTEAPAQQIRALQEKAGQALADAELLLENESVEAAINRGYYAAFQAARAALLTEDESPKTHSGVIRRFGHHFVRTGRVSDEVGDILATAQSMRGRADYEAIADLGREDAGNLVEDVRRFMEVVEAQILSGE